MKFDQDLCHKLQYDFGKMNSTLGSVVPLAMFTVQYPQSTSVTRSTMVSPSISCAIDTMARQRTDIRKYQSLERFQEDTFNASKRVIS